MYNARRNVTNRAENVSVRRCLTDGHAVGVGESRHGERVSRTRRVRSICGIAMSRVLYERVKAAKVKAVTLSIRSVRRASRSTRRGAQRRATASCRAALRRVKRGMRAPARCCLCCRRFAIARARRAHACAVRSRVRAAAAKMNAVARRRYLRGVAACRAAAASPRHGAFHHARRVP